MEFFCERCERGLSIFDRFCPQCGLSLTDISEEMFVQFCPILTFELDGTRLRFISSGVEVVIIPGKPKSPKYEGKFKGVDMTAAEIMENALEIQRRSNSYKAYIWLRTNFNLKYY